MNYYINIKVVYEGYSAYAVLGDKAILNDIPNQPDPDDVVIYSNPGSVGYLAFLTDMEKLGIDLSMNEERFIEIPTDEYGVSSCADRMTVNSRLLKLIDKGPMPEGVDVDILEATFDSTSKQAIVNFLRLGGLESYPIGIKGNVWTSGKYSVFKILATKDERAECLGILLVEQTASDKLNVDMAIIHPLALDAVFNIEGKDVTYIGHNPFINKKRKKF